MTPSEEWLSDWMLEVAFKNGGDIPAHLLTIKVFPITISMRRINEVTKTIGFNNRDTPMPTFNGR